MEYVLKTYGLSKRFGSKLALDNVSINIKKGEIYGLIGKNGAGKTTLMRLALGLANPSGGSIELFDGRRRPPPHRCAFGVALHLQKLHCP